MKKNANKGFSLVELIIVIAIMAVLIGVLAPQFIKQVEKSRESTDLQNIEEVKTAVESYVAENEGITSDIDIELATDNGTTVNISGGGLDATKLATYGLKTSITLKSKKWPKFKISYDKDNYNWKYPATLPEATYYKLDGTQK